MNKHSLNYYISQRDKLCEELKKELLKIKEQESKISNLHENINETIKKASDNCTHIWGNPIITGTREITCYCSICGINEDHKIYGVKGYY